MESRTPPTSLNIEPAVGPACHSTLSPKTPSSTFGRTVIEESQSSVILAVVLSHWDNILGPRIRHLWHIRTLEEQINADVLHYIASHTLSGEICRDPTDSNIDSKFYVLQDKQLIVTAFLFSAIDKGDLVVHSLSVIVHYKHLHIYLNWQQLTTSWMYRGVAKLRILLDKSPETVALSKFGKFLMEFVSMFQSIKEAPIPRNIPITDTVFHHQVQFSSQLTHKAILCHLTTCGRSVVIGRTPGRINVMIVTLSMFLNDQERSCCRYVSADKPWAYHPDLCVQGLLLRDSDELSSTLKNIYYSKYPTTLVDLSSEQVKLSSLVEEHQHLRQEAMQQELLALWRSQDPSYPTNDMFHFYDEPETLVTSFLQQMWQIPAGGSRKEALVKRFLHLLNKKAVTLIKYMETSTCQGVTCLTTDQVKQMKLDLCLSMSGDYNIILALAEKLKPGICSLISH